MAEVDAAIASAYRLKLAGKSGTRDRRPTAGELAAIIAYGDRRTGASIDLGAVVRILSVMPLRLSEFIGIEWADLNDARRSVTLRSRKHPDVLEKEKSQEVPLIAFGGVDTYAMIAGRPRYFDRPFPYHSTSVTAAFAMATLRLRIVDLHLHDLRAHAISALLEGGLPIPQVALLSGHRSWRILAKNYSRIDPVSVHDAIRKAGQGTP